MLTALHVALATDPALRSGYFLERRELGALNIGGAGTVRVNSRSYALQPLDCLYIGRGNTDVAFVSDDAGIPAVFYLLSYLAHCEYPVTLIHRQDAEPTELGSAESCNRRTVYKYIHWQGAKSCQLGGIDI